MVDRQACWIQRHSIVVLDSVPEYPAHRDHRLAGLRNRADNCAGADGFAYRRAAPAGFHSSECFLRNKQRCVVACVLWRAIPLRVAMVANKCAKLFTRNAYRSGDRCYMPDQAVEFATGGSRVRSDRCENHYSDFANTSRRSGPACRTDFVRRNSGQHLDAVDEISVW